MMQTLTIVADDDFEGDEFLELELSLPTNPAPPAGDALGRLFKAVVVILDDDEPGDVLIVVTLVFVWQTAYNNIVNTISAILMCFIT